MKDMKSNQQRAAISPIEATPSQAPRKVRERNQPENSTLDVQPTLSSQIGNKAGEETKDAMGNETAQQLPEEKDAPQKSKESEEGTATSAMLEQKTPATREETGEEAGFRLSLIEHSPDETGTSALADVVEFNLSNFGRLQAALTDHGSFASVIWKNNTPESNAFVAADSVTIEWDVPGHEDTMPAYFKEKDKLEEFLRRLIPAGHPMPNIAYATAHGMRMIYLLDRQIIEAKDFKNLCLRLTVDVGGDLAATEITTVFRAARHVKVFGVHLLHSTRLNWEKLLQTPPKWAMDGGAERYKEALEILDLKPGSHSCLKCPIGKHESDDPHGLRVYDNGIFCFSMHGHASASRVAELAGLAPNQESLLELTKREVERFAPRQDLLDLLAFEIKRRFGHKPEHSKRLANVLFDFMTNTLERETEQWRLKLELFFHGNYPHELREYRCGQFLKHESYEENQLGTIDATYTTRRFEPRGMPGGQGLDRPLHLRMAAPFYFISQNDGGELVASPMSDLSRFMAGEAQSLLGSSLYEIESYTHPVAAKKSGWSLSRGRLPCKIIVPRLTFAGKFDSKIVHELIEDLGASFKFEAGEQGPRRYLGCLVQPLITHETPGQNPAYFFKGPTHSGKGYLGNIFAGRLYANQYGPGVYETNFKKDSHEQSVMLGEAIRYPYAFIDEIIYATSEQLKTIDNLITQQKVQYRKFHVGYLTAPNHLTVTMSAINKNFADETKARLVEIALTESSPETIAAFHRRWAPQMPELMAAIHAKVSAVNLKQPYPSVPNRREGFALLKMVLKEAFDIDVTYELEHGQNDILDVICRMHENPAYKGTASGAWMRYTPKTVADAYNAESRVPMRNEFIHGALNTALGYQSTEQHPAYREGGYATDNGKAYHIKFTEEKCGRGDGRRRFIYVREVSADGAPGEKDPVSSTPVKPNEEQPKEQAISVTGSKRQAMEFDA